MRRTVNRTPVRACPVNGVWGPAVRRTGANRPDSTMFEELVDAIGPLRRPRGRPRQRPGKGHADKAYDLPRCRRFLHRRHITVRIARKGIESREKRGRHRGVVERTLAWLGRGA